RHDFGDPNAHAGRGQRTGDDPGVTAVVPRTGEHQDAAPQLVREAHRDLGRACRAGALHQRARGDSVLDGRAITRSGLRCGYDSDQWKRRRRLLDLTHSSPNPRAPGIVALEGAVEIE